MTDPEPLPEDLPFRIEALDGRRAIVRFAEYVDHRRTAEHDRALLEAMRRHLKLACNLSSTVEIDSDWLTLLADMSVEAKQTGKRVGMVGLRETLRKSADVLGLTALELFDGIDEVWA